MIAAPSLCWLSFCPECIRCVQILPSHRRDRQNGFRFGKNRFRHLLNWAFHVDKTEQKPVLGWPKTGSMIDENRFNGEFKISPWRNFVNRNKLFCYVAPNHSEELENTVCHQRWRKHTNRRRLTRRPRPFFLLYCRERKIEQPNISFIFLWVGGRGLRWGECRDRWLFATISLGPSFIQFPGLPLICVPISWTKQRRAYPPAHSNTYWRFTYYFLLKIYYSFTPRKCKSGHQVEALSGSKISSFIFSVGECYFFVSRIVFMNSRCHFLIIVEV